MSLRMTWPRKPAIGVLLGLAAAVGWTAAGCGGDEFQENPGGSGGATDGGPDSPAGGSAGEGGSGGASGSAGVAGTGGAGGSAGSAGAGGTGGAGGAAGLTISGTVVDSYLLPIPFAKVSIGGVEDETDQLGRFSIVGVSAPYDALLAASSAEKNYGAIFQGVTREDPTLQLPGYPSPAPRSCKLSGSVNLAGIDHKAFLFATLQGQTPVGANGTPLSNTVSNYTTNIQWFGDTSTTADVHVVKWKEPAGESPEAFLHSQLATVTLTNGGQVTLNVSPQDQLQSDMLNGHVSLAASSLKIASKRAFLRSDNRNGSAMLVDELSDSSTFSYAMPVLPGLVPVVCAGVKPQDSTAVFFDFMIECRASTAFETNLELEPPAPPKLTAPPNLQTGINIATNFAWEPVANSVHVVNLAADSSFYVVTMGDTATFPDLSALELPLPSKKTFHYSVSAVGPFQTIDEATGPTGFLEPVNNYGDKRSPRKDGFAGVSAGRLITSEE